MGWLSSFAHELLTRLCTFNLPWSFFLFWKMVYCRLYYRLLWRS